MSNLTLEQFHGALPPAVRRNVDQAMVDNINQAISDPEFAEQYRDNLISYTQVLQQGKFKIQNYLDAVRYVSFKLMGNSNIRAYSSAFPDKIARFNQQNVASKDIASYVTAYNKSKLVNLILEQSLVPTWVLNQDLYQSALNVQADLMLNARSEKVRSDAANSVMTQLKRPETQKLEVDVTGREDKTIEALRASTLELVAQQRAMLKAGVMDAQEVAHTKLALDGEYKDVT